MDNFSVRSERNFHNLAAKPKRMHLLDKQNGYASAMVKSSLSHQMRFTVQKLEKEFCVAGDPHVLQIKLSGDDSREPSSWERFCRWRVRCGRVGHLCPRVLLRGRRGIPGSVPRRRTRGRAAAVERKGVRAVECGPRDCDGVGRQTRQLVILVDASIQTAVRSRAYSPAMPNRMAFSKGLPPLRLQPQQQVAQLGALAGKARLGSLAHPPPLADFLDVRAHAVAPIHHLLEQLGGHARIG